MTGVVSVVSEAEPFWNGEEPERREFGGQLLQIAFLGSFDKGIRKMMRGLDWNVNSREDFFFQDWQNYRMFVC